LGLDIREVFAKLHNSYERIEAGLSHEVMRDFTGAPSYIIMTDEEDLFERLLDWD